ncbi:hypothetical protein VNO77_28327 [Canavalia gladiata]|uniref:B-like cyclin n=1 Tax=Canavalia gladiata TaxID=3824 RepID=A0AAN9KWM3_CANGL
MDVDIGYDTEYPTPTPREREAIGNYLQIESEFMAAANFYTSTSNAQLRRQAVSVIASHWQNEDDAFIPFLAINYFDRFVSRKVIQDVQGGGSTLNQKVRCIAICCLTLSAKMRTRQFLLHLFLRDRIVDIKSDTIMNMEFQILEELNWRMQSVTPFYFLDYYYPTFRRFGGFRRRCINEIIVQSQGDHLFAAYKPSDIALSAFMAATYIAYPKKFDLIIKTDEVAGCCRELIKLCSEKNLQVHNEAGINLRSRKMPPPMPQQMQYEEVATAKGKMTKSDSVEELAAAIEDSMTKDDESRPAETHWAWKVLNTEEEEEELSDEDPEAQLVPRKRDRGKTATETSAYEVVAAETEANQQGQDKGIEIHEEDVATEADANQRRQDEDEAVVKEASAEDVAADTEVNKSGEKGVETETEPKRQRLNKGKGVGEASEIVEAETEAIQQGQDTGKEEVTPEITEDVEADDEFNRQRRAKGKSVVADEGPILEIVPEAYAAPKKLMNFGLKWPISVLPDDIIEHIDESATVSIKPPETIRGTVLDKPPNEDPCDFGVSSPKLIFRPSDDCRPGQRLFCSWVCAICFNNYTLVHWHQFPGPNRSFFFFLPSFSSSSCLVMESTTKNKGKKSLLMSFKSVVGVNDSFKSKGGDPVLAYLAGANKDGVVLPPILSLTLSVKDDSRGEYGNCTRKKVRDRWQKLKAVLNDTSLMKKIISRRKSKKADLFFCKSSKNLEREASFEIPRPKSKSTSRTNSTISSASPGLSPAFNSSTSFSSFNSSSIDNDSDTSFHETYSPSRSLCGMQCGVKETKKGHYYGSKIPLSMLLIISLLVLVIWGKFLAILFTSIWFYLVRPRQGRPFNKNPFSEDIQFDSVQYKRKIIMERLLDRCHSDLCIASSS